MGILKSILAVLAGIVLVFTLSTGTDLALHYSLLPAMNTPEVTTPMLGLALAYRIVFGVAGGWLTARLAPKRKVGHALVLGAIGAFAAGSSVFALWDFGQHWYPIALAVLSVPETWIGGRLAVTRARD